MTLNSPAGRGFAAYLATPETPVACGCTNSTSPKRSAFFENRTGVPPAVEPLLAAGAAGGNGVDVDAQCRTSPNDVYAVGDCARHANRYAQGAHIRLESDQNANDQAVVATKTIAGVEASYDALPWFWSNQYDLRMQTVGLSLDHDEVMVRGDPASRTFTTIYLRNGAVIAMDCVNTTRDCAHGRKAVTDGLVARRERLADVTVAIKDMF